MFFYPVTAYANACPSRLVCRSQCMSRLEKVVFLYCACLDIGNLSFDNLLYHTFAIPTIIHLVQGCISAANSTHSTSIWQTDTCVWIEESVF